MLQGLSFFKCKLLKLAVSGCMHGFIRKLYWAKNVPQTQNPISDHTTLNLFYTK